MKQIKLLTTALAVMLFAVAAQAEPLTVGDNAPDFKLQDQNGDWHQMSDYSGRYLAVYFYPKDDTPGCTTEACNFRDNIYVFRRIGADVVGVSLDDVASHKAFSDKYKLPFTLLADVDGELTSAYGVGREWRGQSIASRQSFIVDPDGVIVKHYSKVNPDKHTQEVIEDLKALMAGNGTEEADEAATGTGD